MKDKQPWDSILKAPTTGQYPKGILVSDAEMAGLNIKHADFHGEWNYTISPRPHTPNPAVIS